MLVRAGGCMRLTFVACATCMVAMLIATPRDALAEAANAQQTHPLPGGFLAKVGKMRSAFGKVNTLHNHVLPWTDRPLVTRNLVGGEDGIDDAGISVSRLIPAGTLFLDATGEIYRGDSGDLFKSSK